MALSRQVIISDGTTTEYPITFADGYLSRDEVSVYEEFDDGTPNADIAFIFINDYLIELSRVPAAGNKIVIERDVEANARKVNFIPQYIKSSDLNTMYKHLLYLIQTVLDGRFEQALIKDLDMGYNRIYNLGAPTQPNDAVRLVDIKTYTDLAERLNNQNAAHEAAAKQSEINAKASADASASSAQSAANTVNGFDAHAAEKQAAFDTNSVDKTSSFNANVVSKTNDFDANAASKTQEYNANAAQKQAQVDASANSAANSATNASTSATNAAQSENNSEIWAEGTDEQVQALGGVHSSKVWAVESSKAQVQTDWNQTDNTQKDYIKNKPTKLSQFTNDIDTLPSQSGNANKFLKTDGTTASWAEIGGGLEIGDIGFAPLGIDETQNKRRYLNGQVISQTQFVSFTNKIKSAVQLYPSLATTETNWQAEVTNSKLGQCGKFVIDDTAGTIRLPKVVNINGLTDLSLLGGIKAESLPNITGSLTSISSGHGSYTTASGAFSKQEAARGYQGGTAGNAEFLQDIDFDASSSSSTYQDNAPVQQEAIQYPYFIQVATGSEESVDVSTEIQLNNPFFFGMHIWSDTAISNASWLISNGSYHSGATYADFYEWLLKIHNGTLTVDGVSVKAYGASAITDYDYVINTADTTFRLPVKVKLASGNAVAGNGMTLGLETTSGKYGLNVTSSNNAFTAYTGTYGKDVGTSSSGSPVSPSATSVGVTTDPTKSGIETSSDGLKLYFYVGETIQDANVINAAGVLTRVSNSIDRTIASDRETVVGWGMPDYSAGVSIKSSLNSGVYTTPCEGIVRVTVDNSGGVILVNNKDNSRLCYLDLEDGVHVSSDFFVEKSLVIKKTYSAGSWDCIFYPLKGVK